MADSLVKHVTFSLKHEEEIELHKPVFQLLASSIKGLRFGH